MSKDIKVGDWVRINKGAEPQYPDKIGNEFEVAEVVDCGRPVFGNGHRYAVGKGFRGGVWFKHLDKIDDPTKPKVTTTYGFEVGDQTNAGKILEFKGPGQHRYTDGWYGEERYAITDTNAFGTWERFLKKVEAPALNFVDDARQQIVSAVFAYRKELIGELDLNRDARPIVQAKLTAVNEILARLQR